MTQLRRFGGAAMISAVLLMFVRMAPIFASGAITFQEFPPDTVAATTKLAIKARAGWELSHLMLLASLALFFIGYATLYLELGKHGQQRLGLLSLVVLGMGLSFYAVAGVIDGFLLPVAANQLGFFAGVAADTARGYVAFGHEAALAFFGQAQTGIVLGIGLISVAIWRARLLNRLLVGIGVGLSVLALVGLLTGLFGDYWRTFATAGPAMMLFFFWQMALGIVMVRSRTTEIALVHPRMQENPA